MSSALRSSSAALLLLSMVCAGCDDKSKTGGAPPPPPSGAPSASSSAAPAALCANGGGDLSDPLTANILPKSAGGYCVDPQGEIKTYGEKGKLSMDEVCTTAFDGECEVYKNFGLKRVVSVRYVDGAGKGGTVEVNLSRFSSIGNAYGMYTLRVVAGDPAEPSTPKPLTAGAAGAIGTGRAYVWRGEYLAELQYVNENENPDQFSASSAAILPVIGKQLGDKIPGDVALPPAAQQLPTANRVPQGMLFQPKDVLGWKSAGPGAIGFYKDGDRRWRVVSIVKDDADQAKDAFKTMKSGAGSLPIANSGGDEGAHVIVPGNGDPKVEMFIVRKGNQIWGVGDEEYALRGVTGPDQQKARLTKDEATAKMKALLASAPASATSGSSAPSSAPSASAPPKK